MTIQNGIVVTTSLAAEKHQHAEGIVLSTGITAGIGGPWGEREQHAEGIVLSTGITAGIEGPWGELQQHAEGIVLSTGITAGASNGCTSGNCSDPTNHAEGIVVSTAITAGIDGGPFGERDQHAEGLILRYSSPCSSP